MTHQYHRYLEMKRPFRTGFMFCLGMMAAAGILSLIFLLLQLFVGITLVLLGVDTSILGGDQGMMLLPDNNTYN